MILECRKTWKGFGNTFSRHIGTIVTFPRPLDTLIQFVFRVYQDDFRYGSNGIIRRID